MRPTGEGRIGGVVYAAIDGKPSLDSLPASVTAWLSDPCHLAASGDAFTSASESPSAAEHRGTASLARMEGTGAAWHCAAVAAGWRPHWPSPAVRLAQRRRDLRQRKHLQLPSGWARRRHRYFALDRRKARISTRIVRSFGEVRERVGALLSVTAVRLAGLGRGHRDPGTGKPLKVTRRGAPRPSD